MSPERALVENFKAVARAITERLRRAEPVPLAFSSGAYLPPRGVPWQVLRDAIDKARAGDWSPLNALERKAAPDDPLDHAPAEGWQIATDIHRDKRLVGYLWRKRGSCSTCDGTGEEEAETRSGRAVDVDCEDCNGSGTSTTTDSDEELITNLAGEVTTRNVLCP